jgi:coiled-coil domain-containing protein 63/114
MASGTNVDLSQLQREYRNMELNRKVYTDETQQVMRRQQAVMDKLKKDNDDMKNELLLATRHLTESSATQQQEQLAKLHDQIESYQRKNVTETKKIETLAQQIQLMKNKVLHQKKHMGGVNAAKENQQMVHKQIRILENRLDKSLIKFNEALAQNKLLREEIDNLRRERVVFDTIYRKLEKEHSDKKKQMAATIELSNVAYEQRDAAQLELRTLQDANRSELDDHRRMVSELMSRLDESKRQTEEYHHHHQRGAPGSPMHHRLGHNGDLTLEDELEMKRKLQKGTWGVAKEKVHVQVSIERVQNFEEAFLKLKAATQIDDLEQLVASFIKKEDQNFSLFNYVNEQSNEMEKLEELLAELREEERRYSDDTGEDISQHKQLLRDLETRLQTTDQAADKLEAKCHDAHKVVTAVKIGIQSLFHKIGCSPQAMVELLGDAVVTEANLMQYLGVIEQRTNDVLHQYATVVLQQQPKLTNKRVGDVLDQEAAGTTNHTKDKESTTGATSALHSVLGMGPLTPMGQEQLQINPPNLEDYSSEDDDDGDNDDAMHPLTRDELKVRTLKGLRRLNHAGGGGSTSKEVRRANGNGGGAMPSISRAKK